MDRMRGADALRALVTGREAAIEQALRHQAAPAEAGPAGLLAAPAESPAATVAPPPVPEPVVETLHQLLRSRRALRQAMLAAVALDAPEETPDPAHSLSIMGESPLVNGQKTA